MKHSFPVLVLDDARKPVTGARVCLVQTSALAGQEHPYPKATATHRDAGDGKYDDGQSIAMAAGNWTLIVTLKGKSPAVQPIKVTTGRDGSFTFTPWPDPVATVTITPIVRKVSGALLKEITSHVTLWPAAELVFISGLDYNRKNVTNGWMFHVYAFDRGEVLRREKKIDPGTILTVFSTPKIWRKKRVYGPKGWVEIETLQLGDPSTRVLVDYPEKKYQPVSGLDIHINAFYSYLADVGKREPKSVKEFGIFSHSWPYGPILYDTNEGDFGGRPERNPTDFDARPKDFNATNFPAHKTMVDSFAPGCAFRIWGCSATALFKDRAIAAMQAIKKKLPEDAFFTVKSTIYNDHVTPAVLSSTDIENTTELRHRYEMDRRFRRGPYAAEAAKKLGIEVRAGTPGTGSDPRVIGGLNVMKVDRGAYGGLFEYYHRKFGPEFAETHDQWDSGYVDYHAVQGRTPVPKPPFSMKYYYLQIQYEVEKGVSPYCLLNFDRPGLIMKHLGTQVSIQTKEVRSLVTPGVNGQVIVLVDKVPKGSRGFYVQEDGRIFLMAQDTFNEWTLKVKEM
jgi:hypothetical protein